MTTERLNHRNDYNNEIRQWLFKVADFAASIPKEQLQAQHKCPACGGRDHKFWINNGQLDYVRCQDCTLLFQNPAPSPEAVQNGFEGEDELLLEYFDIVTRYNSGDQPKPDPTMDPQLRDIYRLRPEGKLLDVGCSIGRFLEKAAYFYQVEGVEINPRTAAIAAAKFLVHRATLAELNLAPEQYDIVTMHQILYGVPDPAALFCDINRILKKGGLLYVNTPNADSFAMSVFMGRCNHLHGYTARNVFNKKALAAMAERAGFRIISFRTEWLDVYLPDLQELHDHPELFLHKRNCHLPDYEKNLAEEEALQAELYPDLADQGNYLVAVLEKA